MTHRIYFQFQLTGSAWCEETEISPDTPDTEMPSLPTIPARHKIQDTYVITSIGIPRSKIDMFSRGELGLDDISDFISDILENRLADTISTLVYQTEDSLGEAIANAITPLLQEAQKLGPILGPTRTDYLRVLNQQSKSDRIFEFVGKFYDKHFFGEKPELKRLEAIISGTTPVSTTGQSGTGTSEPVSDSGCYCKKESPTGTRCQPCKQAQCTKKLCKTPLFCTFNKLSNY